MSATSVLSSPSVGLKDTSIMSNPDAGTSTCPLHDVKDSIVAITAMKNIALW